MVMVRSGMDPVCVTATDWPPMMRLAFRDAASVFWRTLYWRVPEPDPDEAGKIESHEAVLCAFHGHPVPVVIASDAAVVPAAATLMEGGLKEYAHEIPSAICHGELGAVRGSGE